MPARGLLYCSSLTPSPTSWREISPSPTRRFGAWPHSREVVERDFKGVPEDEKRLIVRGNVARLYGLSLS
jgi:hypothetical protein